MVDKPIDTILPGSSDGRRDDSSDKLPPLPLGWTQIKRRRLNDDNSDKNTHNDENDGARNNEVDNNNSNTTAKVAVDVPWCCDDPSCQRISVPPPSVEKDDGDEQEEENRHRVRGIAIMCLHDTNPSWFQGYFLRERQHKPWGLLGVQETLDECLECSDGGYRQITLTVFPFGTKSIQFENLGWTGGDMMRLEGKVSMDAHRLWTGSKAVPYVERYFNSLVDKLRTGNDELRTDLLDLMPDVAIVIGPMSFILPRKEEESDDF